MNRTRTSIPLLAILWALTFAGRARAETRQEDSVEWRTCDSDAVVRGHVLARDETQGLPSDLHAATVHVDEGLKGDPPASLDLRWRGPSDLFAPGFQGVLFLKNGARPPYTGAFRLRTPERTDQAFYRLPLGRGPGRLAFGANMRRIPDETRLLAAIRKRATRRHCGPSRQLAAPVTSDAFQLLNSDSRVWLLVPADDAARARATAEADARASLRSHGGGCGSCAATRGTAAPSVLAMWAALLLVMARRARARAARG